MDTLVQNLLAKRAQNTYLFIKFLQQSIGMKQILRNIFIVYLSGFFCGSIIAANELQRLTNGNVVLYCSPEDLKNGNKVISIIKEVFPKITKDLELSVMKRVTVFIAPSEEEFATITNSEIPEWGIGAADARRSIIFLKSPRVTKPEINFRQVVVHELSHVLLGMALKGKKVDRWFEEGFAMYESGERRIRGAILLARVLFSGEILWLDEIDEVLNFRREKAALAYQESYAAVDYLVENYGKEVLSRIAGAIGEQKEMDQALLSAIGVGFQDFQTDWYHAMRRKYKWYILIDFPVVLSTIFVTLFLIAFIVKRRQTQRKKKDWENETLYEIERLEKNSTSN